MIRMHPLNPLIVESEYQGRKTYYYWCEGCQGHDCFDDTWNVVSWNPLTLMESVKMSQGGHGSGQPEVTVCHVLIKDGVIDYLGDCPHALAGQKLPMQPPKTSHFQGLQP